MTVGMLSFAGIAISLTPSVLKIGAGGFVRALDMNPDGSMFANTDTYGDYFFNPSAANPGNAGGTGSWQLMLKPSSMPANDPGVDLANAYLQTASAFGIGVYELKSAPSNSSILYRCFAGYLYKSVNQGQNWTNLNASFTPLSFADSQSNDGSLRTTSSGPKMAVDPIQPNIVFFSPLGLQPWMTINGGTNWTQLTDLAAPASGEFTGFAYDRRSSTQSGGVSQTIYRFLYGTGCYVSTNAGSNWTKISGSGTTQTGLTTVLQMYVDSQGNLWLTDNTNPGGNNLWKWNGTSWTNINWTALGLNVQGGWSIAEDLTVANAQRIVVVTSNVALVQTLDGGTTWNGGFNTGSANDGVGGVIATDIPYLAAVTDTPGVAGQMHFKPGTSTIVLSTGIGVFTANPPQTFTASTSYNWSSISAGIEQLVANMVISPPGGVPITANFDRAFIRTNGTQFPLTDQPLAFSTSPGGASIDWASSSPSTIVALEAFGTVFVSGSGGSTWGSGLSTVAGAGGIQCIAAASPTNFVQKPNGGNPQVTANGGTNWTDLGSFFNTNFGIALDSINLSTNEQTVCADRVLSNTFYMTMPDGKVYESTNSGTTWSVHSTLPTGLVGGAPMLRSVPGASGVLLYCAGQTFQGVHPYTAGSNCQIFIPGTGWADFGGGNARDIWCIGAGPTIGSKPRIVGWMWVLISGTWTPGVFYTDDFGVTFHLVCSQNLYGTFDLPRWCEVDGNTGLTAYFALQGSGYAKVQFS